MAIKVKEKQREFTARPGMRNMQNLEIRVSLFSKDSCCGPSEEQSRRIDVHVGFPYKGKNGFGGTYLKPIPLSRSHVPAELKGYKLGVSAYFKSYHDEDLNRITEESDPFWQRLSEPYARRLKSAVYETLRAVAEQL